MYVVPSGHFILLALCISLGFALLFEVIEDVKTDGKLGGDKDGWDYLGATFSFTKNGKSKKGFVDAIISTDWNRKKYTSQVFKEFGSSLYSLFF